jgi:GTP1/Obg family GTP-binding protein
MASINNFEQSFADEVYSMQTELKKCGESKKVLMTNKLNRLHEWYQNFKDITVIYEQYKNSIETIQQNAFDDDLIEQALNTLKKIWAKHGLARSFV